jgi:SpoVK/Ycf46/Vps4 family AAA+-type ATPase
MLITARQANRNSEQEFIRQFSKLVDSGAGLIHVRAQEILRALKALRRHIILEKAYYEEWNTVDGFRVFTQADISEDAKDGDQRISFNEAFLVPMQYYREEKNLATAAPPKFVVFVNPHVWLQDSPQAIHAILTYNALLPSSNVCVILLTPDVPLPIEGMSLFSLRFEPPGLGELRASLNLIIQNVKDNFSDSAKLAQADIDAICQVGKGMTLEAFEAHASLALVEEGRKGAETIKASALMRGVAAGKTEVVNQNDLLELYPSADMNEVGGMENLKEWIRKRKDCYSDEAAEFGIQPPKGLVLIGIPGSGKSLAAKAIAREFGIPCVRLDFGRVFNSLLGASENRMRLTLKMVESMAPCILFCAEVDKGLGGMGQGADGGASNRVLGTFLTWVNDCAESVFTVMTANNITHLPPELLRRGRFDAIFATALPSAAERREVLRIHLEKRGRGLDDYSEEEIISIVDASARYVPAEIESAVKDALINAFDANEKGLSAQRIIEAIRAQKPLSEAFKPQIEAMTAWAANNAISVAEDEAAVARRKADLTNLRRTRVRRTSL